MDTYARAGRLFAALTIAALAAAGCAKSSFFYSEKIMGETVHSQIDRQELDVIAVLPENPQRRFDYQIASRAIQTLEGLGWTVVVPQAAARKFTAVTDLCDTPEAPNAIVLVTWNYLSLWDCKTKRVAYEVDGGYAGVDKMAERLTALATADTPPPTTR